MVLMPTTDRNNNLIMDKISSALAKTRDTKFLLLEEGAVSKTGECFARLFPGKAAIIVADVNTWMVAGVRVARSLEQAGTETEDPFIFTDPDLYAEWAFVQMLKERLSSVDAIAVAVGSGVINDLTKYVSFLLGRKYMCVGTAASMDGYTAYGASISKDGNKQAFDCPAPYAFIMDPEIAAAAPKELAASGYADLIAKIPAGADWLLADAMGAEPLDPFSWSLVQDGLKETLSDPVAVHEGDVQKTKVLSEGLLMSGFAMQALMSSRPASGTEHQFSHFWDMENLCTPDGKHVSHGFKVGIGTITSTVSIELILEQEIDKIDPEKIADATWRPWEEVEAGIRDLCADHPLHLARCLKETRGKFIGKEELVKRLSALKSSWPALREKVRAQIIPSAVVQENLRLAGAPYVPEMIGITRERLRRTTAFIPYMRSRVANIDVITYLGLMGRLEERLFGKGGIWEI